ncbi:hyaluronan-binding protein 2-like [Cololabis saira]|uniref:hyaluronan-binding protein 2-like n=1 Tax=Cololabis saira TaxID=129043 RepID=UPI002AD563C2|nr:hyaluronan-binding protein 2-like [Cololabis saira]
MNLKLLSFCFFLAVLLIPASPKPQHKNGNGERSGKRSMRATKRQKFADIIEDVFFEILDTTDDDDDEEGPNTDWLYELQEPDGKCNPNPCLNNGVCKEKGKRFKCDCPKPFKGRKCQRAPKICKRGRCGRGECVLTSTPPYYECKCKYPFQPPDCRSYSVCEPNPCMNGGQCIKDGNDFDCQCPEGFRGRFCHVGPNDCYVDDGEFYRGNVSETDDGDDCLYWNSHFLLENGADPFNAFEDSDGLGPHNFCRNPDSEPKPWCFFRKGRRLLWDYCDVYPCPTPTGEVPTSPSVQQPSTTRAPVTAKPSQAPQPSTGPAVISTANPALTQFLTCGQAQPKKQITRIFGGLKVAQGAIPWQVSLQQKPKNSNRPYTHICGGVLIASCWVLTAAHCIEPNTDMQVVLGSLSLNKPDPSIQTIDVENAIRHENFRETPTAVYNDIGLLRLKGTEGFCANETQFVKAACLPDVQLSDGMPCTISGWGVTEESSFGSNHLLEANVLLINQDKCTEPAVYGKVLDNSMFCAGHLQGGVDSCQGDSGGPLTCKQDTNRVVYGLVSWGDQCGQKNKPGVYTRVTEFLGWIRSKMQASP